VLGSYNHRIRVRSRLARAVISIGLLCAVHGLRSTGSSGTDASVRGFGHPVVALGVGIIIRVGKLVLLLLNGGEGVVARIKHEGTGDAVDH
jgi:hypothetical protein